MTTMWRVVYGQAAPVKVEAETPCWPNRDADGQQIFDNTHFLDEEEAWTRLEEETLAGVSIAGANVKRTRANLANMVEAEQSAVTAAVRLAEVRQARFNRRLPPPPLAVFVADADAEVR